MFYPASDSIRTTVAGTTDNTARTEITLLQSEVERLLILTEALWTILQDKLGYDDNELVKRMVMIDMRDGKLDGKVAASEPQKCPKCGRTLYKLRPRCLYCGEPIASIRLRAERSR